MEKRLFAQSGQFLRQVTNLAGRALRREGKEKEGRSLTLSYFSES
jgi:hypothetical protein